MHVKMEASRRRTSHPYLIHTVHNTALSLYYTLPNIKINNSHVLLVTELIWYSVLKLNFHSRNGFSDILQS